jgi:hypothetical protein
LALHGLAPDAIIRALAAWAQLFGAVNFELFGQFVGSVEDTGALFDQTVEQMGAFVGLRSPGPAPRRTSRSPKRPPH